VPSELRRRVEEQGYVVVSAVVPPPLLEAVVADLYRHIGADPRERATWYRPGLVSPAGMVEMYHYQSMWDTRQYPRVHEVFAEILGTPKLWVTIDRTNFKPPASPDHPEYSGSGFIHWDVDITRYPEIPFAVQGVLALTDTDASMGGFQCVPEIYRELGPYLERRRAAGASPQDLRRVDLTGYTITQVPLRAGDMVIWSVLLPHGNGRNVSDRPRLAQYISMHPARDDDETARQRRIRLWRENLHPESPAFPGDPRRIEEQRGRPAELTPLGRRLLGLDRWD
jgi:ectoine hydroxylase-related dioxygenase (phytanoyl-CoA dioxygenase family)